jgi:hypothetical protein
MRVAKTRRTGLHVHIPGMERGAILAHDIATSLLNMLFRRSCIARVAAGLTRLIQRGRFMLQSIIIRPCCSGLFSSPHA